MQQALGGMYTKEHCICAHPVSLEALLLSLTAIWLLFFFVAPHKFYSIWSVACNKAAPILCLENIDTQCNHLHQDIILLDLFTNRWHLCM